MEGAEREKVSERYTSLIGKLAIPHHAGAAYQTLLSCGLDALPAIRQGLRHQNADVRAHCCRFLDQFLAPELMDDLVTMLDDPDHRVRLEALHTLSCDRCKEGECRLDEATVLPRAVALLVNDPDAHVRGHAVGLVGRWVHTSPDAEAALLRAKSDASPAVRKRAAWYAPGGVRHRKTAPKVARTAKRERR